MSEELKFKGSEYLQALTFTQNLGKEPGGYTEVSKSSRRIDKILIQQNNNILSLLSHLNYRLTALEKLIAEVPKPTQSFH